MIGKFKVGRDLRTIENTLLSLQVITLSLEYLSTSIISLQDMLFNPLRAMVFNVFEIALFVDNVFFKESLGQGVLDPYFFPISGPVWDSGK